jgi:hypothetical protein
MDVLEILGIFLLLVQQRFRVQYVLRHGGAKIREIPLNNKRDFSDGYTIIHHHRK